HLEKMIGSAKPSPLSALKRWWPAAAVGLLSVGLIAYLAMRRPEPKQTGADATNALETVKAEDLRLQGLVEAAEAQRRRNQYNEALATLARALELSPSSAQVHEAQQDVAMEWIRNVRVENDNASFGDRSSRRSR